MISLIQNHKKPLLFLLTIITTSLAISLLSNTKKSQASLVPSGSITICSFRDNNFDGQRDYKDTPLVWEYALKIGNTYKYLQTNKRTGCNTLENIPLGNYTIYQTLNSSNAWINTYPGANMGTVKQEVNLTQHNIQPRVTFLNYNKNGSINIYLHTDTDGNINTTNDQTLSKNISRKITISGNNYYQSQESKNGKARFTELNPGTYYVTQLYKNNWETLSETQYKIKITQDNLVHDVNFINYRPTGSITVCSFRDNNLNGIKDSGDTPLEWNYGIYTEGKYKYVQTNKESGCDTFFDIPTRYHTVYQVKNSSNAWVNTFPKPDSSNNVKLGVTLNTNDENKVITFLNYNKNGSINILTYTDTDGNIKTTNDKLLSVDTNWQTTITKGDFTAVETTKNGKTRFTGLNPGTYTIAQVQKEKWTTISSTTHQVTITQDNLVHDVSFVNSKTKYTPPKPKKSSGGGGRGSGTRYPQNLSIKLNSKIKDNKVDLKITAKYANMIMIANTEGFANASWQGYSPKIKNWQLDTNNTKIYIKFRSSGNKVSTPITCDIPREKSTTSTENQTTSTSTKPIIEKENKIQVKGIETNYRTIQLNKITTEAKNQLNSNINTETLNNNKFHQKYTSKLIKNTTELSTYQTNTITNFIEYGTGTTLKLGAGERAGILGSYKSAFNKLPSTESEWTDLIKIGNGRWPSKQSDKAEQNANLQFKKIYKRDANMDNPNDNAAVTIIAYGLRNNNRNLNSEKTAIKTFKYIYKYNPISATDWDIVRAIAYSGATR